MGLCWGSGSGSAGVGVMVLEGRTWSVEVLHAAAGQAAGLARGGLRGAGGGPALQPLPDDLWVSSRTPGSSASPPPFPWSPPQASQSWGKRCRYSPPEMEEERWIWETRNAAESKMQFIPAAPVLPGHPLSGGVSPTGPR